MRRTMTVAMAALLAIALLAAPVSAKGDKAPSGDSIVDIALAVNADTGEFSTLIAALGSAEVPVTPLTVKASTPSLPRPMPPSPSYGLNAGNVGRFPAWQTFCCTT